MLAAWASGPGAAFKLKPEARCVHAPGPGPPTANLGPGVARNLGLVCSPLAPAGLGQARVAATSGGSIKYATLGLRCGRGEWEPDLEEVAMASTK